MNLHELSMNENNNKHNTKHKLMIIHVLFVVIRVKKESESETANLINVTADHAAVSVDRHPLDVVMSCRGSMRRWSNASGTIMNHTHRGRRCQRTAPCYSQHIAHLDILPLRTVVGAANGGRVFSTFF